VADTWLLGPEISGRLDTGAEGNFLKESTCTYTTIEFGNGSTTISSATAHLNSNLTALVVSDINLIEDLISINPIVDLGYNVILSQSGGWILANQEKVMPIIRNKSKWVIDIAELRSLSVQQCLLINKIDDTKRKVMLLHQRMAHASTKVMIEAIRSKS